MPPRRALVVMLVDVLAVDQCQDEKGQNTMGKLVGYLLTTLDGVVEAGDWIEQFDDDMQDFMVEVINEQDAVLLGRVTYQDWAAFWPTATDESAFARFINPVPKYVVSTTLSTDAEWQPTTVHHGRYSPDDRSVAAATWEEHWRAWQSDPHALPARTGSFG